MSFINKFGESSVKVKNPKRKICEHNLQINRLNKDMQKIHNELKGVQHENLMFSNEIEKKIHDIEDIVNTIDGDIKVMREAVKNQINFSNKDLIKNIEERFGIIEDFIFKYFDQTGTVDVVKTRKIDK